MERVYVECGVLDYMPMTGVGRFMAQVVKALVKKCDVRILKLERGFPAGMPGVRKLERLITPKILSKKYHDISEFAEAVMHGILYRSEDAEIAESVCIFPYQRPDYRLFRKEINILFDMTPYICSHAHAKSTVTEYPEVMHLIAKHSDLAIAISEQSKFDANLFTTIPSNKIITVLPGPSLCVEEHDNKDAVIRSKNIILGVSTIEPRKNGPFLFDWFSKTNVLPLDFELWLVGGVGWWTDKKHVEKMNAIIKNSKRKIKLLGKVTDAELCQLYRRARFTIYPSFYEGFGFPVIDSLLHNTPVITSGNSSLQEFSSEGLFFCDPCRAETLDQAVLDLFENESSLKIDLQGLRQKYNWDNYSDRIMLEVRGDAC